METRSLIDEEAKGQKITLEEEGKMLTGKMATNAFAQEYARESDMTIPLSLKKAFKREEKEQTTNAEAHDSMTKDITMHEPKNPIKQQKKKIFEPRYHH